MRVPKETRTTSRRRGANRLLAFLVGIVVASLGLMMVFWRYEVLQVEFLDLNFDSVHSTRTLLKTAILMTEVDTELRQLEGDFSGETLNESRAIVDMAVAYEASGQYYQPQQQEEVRERLQGLQADMAGVQRAYEQEGARPSPEQMEALRGDVRRISHQLENMERNRWGMLSAMNQELRDRMEHNASLAVAAAVLLLLILASLVWSVTNQMRMERLLVREKKTLEREVEQRRNTEEALRESNERFRELADLSFDQKERAQVTLASIVDAVITTDGDGIVDYLNPAAESVIGWQHGGAAGRHVGSIMQTTDERTGRMLPDPVTELLHGNSGEDISTGVRLLHLDSGDTIVIESSAAAIRNQAGRAVGAVLVFRDVSEARKLEHELTHQATHDSLTDLVNRREFERRLQLALESARTNQATHTLLYLDLDQFKVVNDTFGHVAGDELLRQLSKVLQRPLRARDTLARLGGDEFGVLLEGCDSEPGQRIAERLRESVAGFDFHWDGRHLGVGVSIGVVSFDGRTMSLADLLAYADAGCYIAKDRGRNAVHVYHPGDADIARRHGEMQWLLHIQQALQEERLCLFAQNIVGLKPDTRDHSIELLVRMVDRRGQVVPPEHFIPAAERYDLMPAMDRWVFRTALSRLAELREQDPDIALTCCINVSGGSLGDESFRGFVQQEIEAFGVPWWMICFEITETAAIENLGEVTRFIREQRERGCRFALDDFGSGMSSFAYLKQLPVDFLKIDGSLVRDMATESVDHAMVEAIISIARATGIRTIAEFVEDDATRACLQRIGVDYVQGFGVHEPEYWAGREPVVPRFAIGGGEPG
ncbi:EAL domain-containing protein [Aquisalimonas sp.]|uniref:EAL domain-containing protein n=1 Tax=unclassified Aquisalimonas TaxID=2644645 RepID=UPI0025BA8740|nr:EAL domain-containing protein [Aquisalimonas sp.]